jgi:molybdenum cofactor cytidylyltransferase
VANGRGPGGTGARASTAGDRAGRRSVIGFILLAAGGSTRMGRSKQALPHRLDADDEPGESLLRHAVRVAVEAALRPTVVVLGADAELLAQQVADLAVHSIAHSGWQRGIGSSIKVGVEGVRALAPAIDGVIIAVCDQPHLSTAVLNGLGRAYRGSNAPIVASGYSGTSGVPALFDRTLFAELQALGDRDGARRLIALDPERTRTVPFPLGAVDLDTPEAYEQYLGSRRVVVR